MTILHYVKTYVFAFEVSVGCETHVESKSRIIFFFLRKRIKDFGNQTP